MNPTVYLPLDLSGQAPSNLIQNETHTLQECNFKDYYIVIPNLFPFYEDNLHVSLVRNGNIEHLQKNIDYELVIPNLALMREAGKAIYSGISFFDYHSDGVVSITYQSYGSNICADRVKVLQFLADKAYNLRQIAWENITNKPLAFAPSQHFNYFNDIYGQDIHVDRLQEIIDAILNRGNFLNNIISGILDTTNPDSSVSNILVNRYSPIVDGNLRLVEEQSNPNNLISYSSLLNAISSLQSTIDSIIASYNNKINKSNDTFDSTVIVPSDPTQPNEAATYNYLINATPNGSGSFNTGDIIGFVDETTASSSGFIKCNGAKLAISSYPDLFNAIGHTFDNDGKLVVFNPMKNQHLTIENAQPLNLTVNNLTSFDAKFVFPSGYNDFYHHYYIRNAIFITKNKIFSINVITPDMTQYRFCLFKADINPDSSIGIFSEYQNVSGFNVIDNNVSSIKIIRYGNNGVYIYYRKNSISYIGKFNIDTNGDLTNFEVIDEINDYYLSQQNLYYLDSLQTSKKFYLFLSVYDQISYRQQDITVVYDIDEADNLTNRTYNLNASTSEDPSTTISIIAIVPLKTKIYRFKLFSKEVSSVLVSNIYIDVADVLLDGTIGNFNFYRKDLNTGYTNIDALVNTSPNMNHFVYSNTIYLYDASSDINFKYTINPDESLSSLNYESLTYNAITKSIESFICLNNYVYVLSKDYDSISGVSNSINISSITTNYGTNNYIPYTAETTVFDWNNYSFGTPWEQQYKFNNNNPYGAIDVVSSVGINTSYTFFSNPVLTKNRIHLLAYKDIEPDPGSYNSDGIVRLISYTLDNTGTIIGQVERVLDIFPPFAPSAVKLFLIKDKVYCIPTLLQSSFNDRIYVGDVDIYGNINNFRLTDKRAPDSYVEDYLIVNTGNKIHTIPFNAIDGVSNSEIEIYTTSFNSRGEIGSFYKSATMMPIRFAAATTAVTNKAVYVIGNNFADATLAIVKFDIGADYNLINPQVITPTFTIPGQFNRSCVVTSTGIYILSNSFITEIPFDINGEIDQVSVQTKQLSSVFKRKDAYLVATSTKLYSFNYEIPNYLYFISDINVTNFSGGTNDLIVDITPPAVAPDPDYFRVPNLNDKIDYTDNVNYYIKT